MKKLFAIIVLMFTFTAVNAQIATLYLNEGQTYVEYSTNVTLTNSVAQYFHIIAPKDYYTAQAYTVNLDSLAGNHTSIAVVLAGRISDQTGWTTISTTTWGSTTSDTTMTVLNATENGYREFKITFTGAGTGTSTIDNFEFKQWLGLP